ncbi:hypothetical protein AVEN_174462-1 [Araneus ventricosus]|uniref:Uncharacterized protein n=1 Tax=Araneus ventricosus TaxID=182803 RepID=A0A4Y2VPK2_ARAVE|nr:hypothetical protein AVEN_105339-1 [Araneus ventricosus]GBO25881.1 hypothetical protein AVEN_174462-1 [Araneus ventricosus]
MNASRVVISFCQSSHGRDWDRGCIRCVGDIEYWNAFEQTWRMKTEYEEEFLKKCSEETFKVKKFLIKELDGLLLQRHGPTNQNKSGCCLPKNTERPVLDSKDLWPSFRNMTAAA